MKVTILQPTRHDGKRLAVGDVVNLSEPAAKALIACGAAEEGGSSKKAPPAEAPVPAPAPEPTPGPVPDPVDPAIEG